MPADSMSMIIMMVVMIGVFYFFLIRPENKKKKAMNEMRNSRRWATISPPLAASWATLSM